jgi:CRP-like cAMP-binding protein
LRSLPNFVGLPDDSLLHTAEAARERRFRAGDVLYDERQPVDRVYILIGGRVELTRRGRPFLTIEAPGGVGVLAALAHELDGWRGVALTDTVTLELPIGALYANLEDDFALLRNSLRLISIMALQRRGNLPVEPDRAPPLPAPGPYPERDPTLVECIIGLRRNATFAAVNMDAVIEIARRMTLVHVEPGHQLCAIGEPADHSLRINHGVVRCTAPSGEHVDMGEGAVLGALDAMASQPRSYSIRAETRVACYRMPLEAFVAVIEMHPSLGLNLLRGVAQSLLGS